MSESNLTPVLAHVGMRVLTQGLDNGNDHTGTIVQMFNDSCVVWLDEPRDASEGDAPNPACVPWNDVYPLDVKPDPTQVTPAPVATEEIPQSKDAPTGDGPRCVVQPGMRVKIPTGDGNDDRPGTIVYVHPECCVVKLDERAEYATEYTACEWYRVTMLNLGPVEGGDHA